MLHSLHTLVAQIYYFCIINLSAENYAANLRFTRLKKIEESMRIDGNKFISECTTYDFKRDVEEKKVRSWLKNVSAIFAKGTKASQQIPTNYISLS